MVFVSTTFGQSSRDTEDSPITALYGKDTLRFGVVFGFNNNFQNGSMGVACDCPLFSGGRGTSFTIGILGEDHFQNTKLRAGFELLFDNRSFSKSYVQNESVSLKLQSSGREEQTSIQFRSTADFSMNMVTFLPYFKWQPVRFWWLRAAPSIGIVLSSNILHTKELTQTEVTLSDGTPVSLRIDSLRVNGNNQRIENNRVIIEDGSYPNLNGFQVAVALATGFDIRMSRKTTISPMVQYLFPFTTVADLKSPFSISTFQILIEIRSRL